MKYISLLLFLIFTLSCNRVLYNVNNVIPTRCSNSNDTLTLTIENKGLIGISNLQINSDQSFINLGGLEPRQISCSFAIPPIYTRPNFKIYVLRPNGTSQSIGTSSIDHIGESILKSGAFILTISLNSDKGVLKVDHFEIKKK